MAEHELSSVDLALLHARKAAGFVGQPTAGELMHAQLALAYATLAVADTIGAGVIAASRRG